MFLPRAYSDDEYKNLSKETDPHIPGRIERRHCPFAVALWLDTIFL